jgi:hypothetical protein
MYFWRINKLKQQLAERPLTAREELPYLVLYVALTTAVPFATAAVVVPQTEEYIPVAVDAAVTVGIAVFGTIHIYQQNGVNGIALSAALLRSRLGRRPTRYGFCAPLDVGSLRGDGLHRGL